MVGAVYDQLQRLMLLLRNKHQTAKECRWHIRHFLALRQKRGQDAPRERNLSLAR